MATQIISTNLGFSPSNANTELPRPTAKFHENIWGDLFLNYTPDDEVTQSQKEQEVKELKMKVERELLASNQQALKQLNLINTLERLGVAYHFEKAIEETLQNIYDTHSYDHEGKADLYHGSLLFRIMRQHGFPVTCNIFKNFLDENGSFKKSLTTDVQGLLSLYEALHLRVHGEEILDKAVEFTTTHLKLMANRSSLPLAAQINHALKQTLHRGLPRLEARRYITFYEQEPFHDNTLLKFAKLDYNLLQSQHKQEIKDLNRWWKALDFAKKLPFARDRVVEAYFWGWGVFYEPQYAISRKICSKMCLLTTIIDDIYDAYGTVQELELFTKAVDRWDDDCLSDLPDYMKFPYQTLVLDVFNEFEQDLAIEGRSHCVYYAREQLKVLCRTYLQEAKWREEKYIPTYDEYMANAIPSIAYILATVSSYLGMGEIATEESFKWICQLPKILKASCIIARLQDDVGGHKFQKGRDHVASAVDCYIRQYNVSEEHVYEEFNRQVEDAWKDMNQEMLKPTIMPMPLLTRVLNLTRVIDVMYKGEDGYTNVGQNMKGNERSVKCKVLRKNRAKRIISSVEGVRART
ncbi:hypothetical protein Ancab_028803 [Ancistrocladus abbreviatus]